MLACYIISGIYNEVFRDSAHLHALSLPNRATVICPLDLKHLCSIFRQIVVLSYQHTGDFIITTLLQSSWVPRPMTSLSGADGGT